jgi:8-oxo-dGTP pyrophosphatase MutT (NUDIX family)
MQNWSYKITDPEHPKCGYTLWSGRYCAVCGIVLYRICDKLTNICKTYILANQRGQGTPDYQGYWNLPCGFLEANETGKEGCCREILEECGLKIKPTELYLYGVETDPSTCNNGNVTIRYIKYVTAETLPELKYLNINGEENEVANTKWIAIDEVDNYKWAFHHRDLITNIIETVLLV